MIVFQLILFCALFTLLVRIGAGNSALNCLYFYPRAYQEKAFERKLADRKTVAHRRKCFMLPFILVMLAALLLIIGWWNQVRDFWTAYWQALLFLEVMNWYDGIVIDRLWVGTSRFWIMPGMEGVPYVQPWPVVLKKRGILTLVWILGAAAVSGLILMIF